MSLSDEVIEVLRAERSEKGRARLAVHTIRERVTRKRRSEQPIRTAVFGPLWQLLFAPSTVEVHDTIHKLKQSHPNLVSAYSYGRGVEIQGHECAYEI